MMRLLTEIAIQAVFYSSLGFVIVLSTFWAWWRSQLGWTIAAKSLALAGAVFPAMFIYWFGINGFTESPVMRWLSVCVLLTIPPILVWRLIVLYRVQRSTVTRYPPVPPRPGPGAGQE
jgi:hypothetical protein